MASVPSATPGSVTTALSVDDCPSNTVLGDALTDWMTGATSVAVNVSGPMVTVLWSVVLVAVTLARYAPGRGGVKSKKEIGEVPEVVPEIDAPLRFSMTV